MAIDNPVNNYIPFPPEISKLVGPGGAISTATSSLMEKASEIQSMIPQAQSFLTNFTPAITNFVESVKPQLAGLKIETPELPAVLNIPEIKIDYQQLNDSLAKITDLGQKAATENLIVVQKQLERAKAEYLNNDNLEDLEKKVKDNAPIIIKMAENAISNASAELSSKLSKGGSLW